MDVTRVVIGAIYGVAVASGVFLTYIISCWIYETHSAWVWKKRQDRKG